MTTKQYARWLVDNRWLVLILSVLLMLVAGYGMSKVRFSDDNRDFFAKDDPRLLAFNEAQYAYTDDRTALVAFQPSGGTVFNRATLAALEDFTTKAWTLPYVRRVDSITNFQHTQSHDDELVVRPLVKNADALSDVELQAIKTTALNEPLLVKKLISPQGDVTGIHISFVPPGRSMDEKPAAVKAVRELVDQFRKAHPSITVYTAGELMLDNAFAEQSQKDMATLTPLMYLAILVILAISIRSLLGVMTTFIIITVSIVVAVGAAGLLGLKFTAVSVSAPTILMTIAVANCMHLMIYMLQRMGAGDSRHEAVRQAIVAKLPIMAVVCGTDALGFFSLCITDVPPLADMGIILGVGALAVFVLSVTLMPALVALLPIKGSIRLQKQGAWMGHVVVKLIDRRYAVFAAAIALNVLAGYFVLQNRFEDNFVQYFGKSIEFRQDVDFISEHLTGVHEVVYSINAPTDTTVASPAYLEGLDKLTTWLRAQPEVFNVSSLSDIVKKINRTVNNDSAKAYRIPDNANESAQLLLMFEMSLPQGLELNDKIKVDRSASKLSVVVKDITSTELIAFDQRVQDWMKANLPAGMPTAGTGLSLLFSNISAANVSSTIYAYILQLTIISVVIGVILRSVTLGLASLVPNFVPSIIAFGIWGAAVGYVGLSVSVVAVLTYGIIVDDTIHSIFKYHHARKVMNLDPRSAIRHTYSVAGLNIVYMTLVLVLGFMVLTLSGFDLNHDLGIMSALTIGIAAAVDLLLLPALLFEIDSRREARAAQAVVPA